MEHPVLRPLYQLLEPLLRLERQIHVLQTTLENWTELHNQLEDANLPDIAHDLQRMIYNYREGSDLGGRFLQQSTSDSDQTSEQPAEAL